MLLPCKNEMICNTSIEKLTESDRDAIYSLISRTFPHMSHMYDFWMSRMFEGDTSVAKKDGNVIGLISILPVHNTPYVGLIAVDAKYENHGIGSELLKLAEEIGKKSGSNEILLHTEANKIENMNFYNKNGWIVEHIDIIGYGHSSSVLFKKSL